jgi:hypothetical protein
MNFSNRSHRLTRPLLLASALLFNACGAMAADLQVDAQTQARMLLSGSSVSRSAALAAFHAAGTGDGHLSAIDAQQQVRRAILGSRASGATAPRSNQPVIQTTALSGAHTDPGADASAQARARRLILGGAG